VLTTAATSSWPPPPAPKTNSRQANSDNHEKDGENVLFLSDGSKDPLQFRRQVMGISVASPVWLSLDLWAWPKRGKEQARRLRSELLPY